MAKSSLLGAFPINLQLIQVVRPISDIDWLQYPQYRFNLLMESMQMIKFTQNENGLIKYFRCGKRETILKSQR